MPDLYKNKNWLFKRLYVDHKSITDIAKECECTIQTIYRQMTKFGFKK